MKSQKPQFTDRSCSAVACSLLFAPAFAACDRHYLRKWQAQQYSTLAPDDALQVQGSRKRWRSSAFGDVLVPTRRQVTWAK